MIGLRPLHSGRLDCREHWRYEALRVLRLVDGHLGVGYPPTADATTPILLAKSIQSMLHAFACLVTRSDRAARWSTDGATPRGHRRFFPSAEGDETRHACSKNANRRSGFPQPVLGRCEGHGSEAPQGGRQAQRERQILLCHVCLPAAT